MIFPIKNEEEILQEMMDEVIENTSITNLTPGSIARTLLEIFNRRLSTCYRNLDIYASMSFLSTAQGIYLDMIGELLSCRRLLQETDANYKYRISQQVYNAAAANAISIRLRCLAVPEIKDVIVTPYSYGNGSFTVHIITDEIDTPANVLSKASAIIAETKAEGIRAIVAKPRLVPIDITFNVTRKPGNMISDTTIGKQVKDSVGDYIDMISLGGTISVQEIINAALLNANINQAYISSLSINKNPAIISSQHRLEWDERAYVNDVIVIV